MRKRSQKKQERVAKYELLFGIEPNWIKKGCEDGEEYSEGEVETREKRLVEIERFNVYHPNNKKTGVAQPQDESESSSIEFDEFPELSSSYKQPSRCPQKCQQLCKKKKKQQHISPKREIWDRMIISVVSPWYQVWKFFFIITCFLSSFFYAFLAAFFDEEYQTRTILLSQIVFEVIIGVDILLQFFLEYKPEDS